MSVRKFLHLFGVHYWEEWSEPEVVKGITLTYYKVSILIQQRNCIICNKLEERQVESDN